MGTLKLQPTGDRTEDEQKRPPTAKDIKTTTMRQVAGVETWFSQDPHPQVDDSQMGG